MSQFLCQIGADGGFGVFENTGRRGVLVADNALGPFVGQIVAVGLECAGHVLPCLRQQIGTVGTGLFGEEFLEAVADAGLGGNAGNAGFLVAHPPAFGDGESA